MTSSPPSVAIGSEPSGKPPSALTGDSSPETGPLSTRGLTRLRIIACLLAAGFFAYYICVSLHWPVLWDAGVMHYVYFLMTRGFHPYSGITDMNLPGCYLAEGWAMRIFGWGDLSWRIYEYFLMLVLAASSAIIGGRRWMAGIYCALFFTLMHGAEGPAMAVERDEVMTVLLVAGTAFFFLALRRNKPVFLLPFGLLCGFAASMKPAAALVSILLTVFSFTTARRQGYRAWAYVLWALLGQLVIVAIMLAFLIQQHAFSGLLFIARDVLPSYVKERNYGRLYLLRHLTPVPLLLLVCLAVTAALVRRERWSWERSALLLATAGGVITYWLQAKGYLYHRYVYAAFLLIWVGWELSASQLVPKRLPRFLEIAGLGVLFLVAAPFYTKRIYDFPRMFLPPQVIASAIQDDLSALGGPALQHQVQCLDLVNGCLTALYHLRLVQNTGTTGDLLLFSPRSSPAVAYYRNWFFQQEQAHPPDVVVLGNEWYFAYVNEHGNKLDTWPAYKQVLETNYVPVVERTFGANMLRPASYSIYLRKNSPVLKREQGNPLR